MVLISCDSAAGHEVWEMEILILHAYFGHLLVLARLTSQAS